MNVIPNPGVLGASIEGLDLSQPLDTPTVDKLINLLGRHGVLAYPDQHLTPRQLRDFSRNFGELEINVAQSSDSELPEVMTLSNIVENGKPIGLADAGQDWHTDMSYSNMIAFTNILYGLKIPHRDGKPLGNTEFCSMHAAYDALPDPIKTQLDGKTITHDFNKFWENMRQRPGSTRPPLTGAQRRAKPPAVHPAVMIHPITQRKVLYANPGYSIRINQLPEDESDKLLAFLFEHQLRPEFRYAHPWQVNTLLMWDNMGTIHNAVADYRADEPRLIKRCQVKASRFFKMP